MLTHIVPFRMLVKAMVFQSVLSAFWSLTADPLQKNMLTVNIGHGQRFALTDRVWPAAHGAASVCL
jgi:hypothetical protein